MDHWTVTMTNKGNFTSFVTKAITMWNECSEGRPASDVWEHCSEPGLQYVDVSLSLSRFEGP